MGYQAHKIIDGLYQGGAPPTGDALQKAGVDVLVLCAASIQDVDSYKNILVIPAPGDDDPRPSRLKLFIDTWRDAAHQVAGHVKAGRKVLVTCRAGQNRSGLVVGLALRELTGWDGAKIVDLIVRSRPHALNNQSFAKYIIRNFP
jgi:protein-tyrosine phosphatase